MTIYINENGEALWNPKGWPEKCDYITINPTDDGDVLELCKVDYENDLFKAISESVRIENQEEVKQLICSCKNCRPNECNLSTNKKNTFYELLGYEVKKSCYNNGNLLACANETCWDLCECQNSPAAYYIVPSAAKEDDDPFIKPKFTSERNFKLVPAKEEKKECDNICTGPWDCECHQQKSFAQEETQEERFAEKACEILDGIKFKNIENEIEAVNKLSQYLRSLENQETQDITRLKAEIKDLRLRVESCRNYVMGERPDNLTIEKVLISLGYNGNGF